MEKNCAFTYVSTVCCAYAILCIRSLPFFHSIEKVLLRFKWTLQQVTHHLGIGLSKFLRNLSIFSCVLVFSPIHTLAICFSYCTIGANMFFLMPTTRWQKCFTYFSFSHVTSFYARVWICHCANHSGANNQYITKTKELTLLTHAVMCHCEI